MWSWLLFEFEIFHFSFRIGINRQTDLVWFRGRLTTLYSAKFRHNILPCKTFVSKCCRRWGNFCCGTKTIAFRYISYAWHSKILNCLSLLNNQITRRQTPIADNAAVISNKYLQQLKGYGSYKGMFPPSGSESKKDQWKIKIDQRISNYRQRKFSLSFRCERALREQILLYQAVFEIIRCDWYCHCIAWIGIFIESCCFEPSRWSH